MEAITSRFLHPPEEQELTRMLDGIESEMSALYGIQTTLAIVTQKSQALGLNLAEAVSVIQGGKNELFAQCERISKLFENIFAQVQAYKIIGLSNFESRGIYLEKSIQEAQWIVSEFRAIVSRQTGTVEQLQKLSQSLGEFLGAQPEGGKRKQTRNSMPRDAFAGSPSQLLSPTERTAAWPRRFSFDVAKLQGKQSPHLKEISTHLNEGIKASTQALESLKALDSYYSLYLGHLRSSVPSTRGQGASYSSSDIVRRDDSSHEFVVDMQRMEVVWTKYQEVVTDVVTRLLRVADTVGTSRPMPVYEEPSPVPRPAYEEQSPAPRPADESLQPYQPKAHVRSQTMPTEHIAATPSGPPPFRRAHNRRKTVPAVTSGEPSDNPRKRSQWWKWSVKTGWSKFSIIKLTSLWTWLRPGRRQPESSM